MRHTLQKVFLVLLLACIGQNATADTTYDFMVDSIYYHITNASISYPTVEVTYKGYTSSFSLLGGGSTKYHYYNLYNGDIVVPKTVTYENTTYTVTGIRENAFYKQTGEPDFLGNHTKPKGVINSIKLPNTIKYIGKNAFRGCSALTSFIIPSSVKSIGEDAFSGCTGLVGVYIHDGVTSIGLRAFGYCTSLTLVNIPNSLTSVSDSTFYGCAGLTSITIPSSVTSIGNNAFYGCAGLTSITIPYNVTSIGTSAFNGCTSLTYISIKCDTLFTYYDFTDNLTCPIYVKNDKVFGKLSYYNGYKCRHMTDDENVGYYTKTALGAATVHLQYIGSQSIDMGDDTENHIISAAFISTSKDAKQENDSSFTMSLLPGTKGYMDGIKLVRGYRIIHQSTRTTIVGGADAYDTISIYPIYETEQPTFYIGVENRSVGSIKFLVSATSDSTIAPHETGVEYDGKRYAATADSIVKLSSLPVGKSIHVRPYAIYRDSVYYGTEKSYTPQMPSISASKDDCGQTWVKIRIYAPSYDGATVTGVGMEYNGENYPINFNGNTYIYGVISDLFPSASANEISIHPYVIYNSTDTVYADYISTNTVLMSTILAKAVTSFPTSFKVNLAQSLDKELSVKSQRFTYYHPYEKKNYTESIHFNPGYGYYLNYDIELDNGRGTSEYSGSISVYTSALELTTLQPKVVSSKCAIAAATTNISEEETNVGFQWKKYEAPDELAPNEGYSAIYDGQMEGYLKNLQATYYKVRAFYKSASDTYYYGDWVTFDQTDFSYFEPTVHTYDVTDVTHNTASVKGYVMQGTDEVTEQGFEYWASTSSSAARMVKRAPAATDDVTTVFATGQVMTATLEDLRPNTSYCVRAFVTTASGTVYGEEQTFTTEEEASGVYAVQTDEAEPTVMGYYDLQGRKLNAMTKGVNILMYSDGTSKKIYVK